MLEPVCDGVLLAASTLFFAKAPASVGCVLIDVGRHWSAQVVVFTGLFEATPNSASLASVLGHEVGHVVANHGGEKVSKVRALVSAATCLFL